MKQNSITSVHLWRYKSFCLVLPYLIAVGATVF